MAPFSDLREGSRISACSRLLSCLNASIHVHAESPIPEHSRQLTCLICGRIAMNTRVPSRWQRLTIIAQDPSVRTSSGIVRASIDVPAEGLAPGPWGHRIQVVDFDTTSNTLYSPPQYEDAEDGTVKDPFENKSDEVLLNDPRFHAQNAYAIAMRTLERFEHALGRRVAWEFRPHQIKIIPHAFADANAFYSRENEAILFGYFKGDDGRNVLTALSHDVVAHETTHALLDGLRQRYVEPSSSDQAAFHEAFADIVALLSVFAMQDVVAAVLSKSLTQERIPEKVLSPEALKQSALIGLAEEVGQELSHIRGDALRRSATLTPSKRYLDQPEFKEPHRRGEILVAAVMNAFIEIWSARMMELRRDRMQRLDSARVTEEGAMIADRLLTMVIRAIDYCPPVHIVFSDFLSAMLTADYEISPVDSMYHLRNAIRRSFDAYGISPSSSEQVPEPGIWKAEIDSTGAQELTYSRSHFESMQRDPQEMFRFIWENRKRLELAEGAYTEVESVRPCIRLGDDGFMMHETVAEYVQILTLEAAELAKFGFKKPEGLDPDETVMLFGGGVLIFNEFGRLKFHIHNHLKRHKRQNKRLQQLFEFGFFPRSKDWPARFARMHLNRALDLSSSNE